MRPRRCCPAPSSRLRAPALAENRRAPWPGTRFHTWRNPTAQWPRHLPPAPSKRLHSNDNRISGSGPAGLPPGAAAYRAMLHHRVDQAVGEQLVAFGIEMAPGLAQRIELQGIARCAQWPVEIDRRDAELVNRVEHSSSVGWNPAVEVVLIGDHHEVQVAAPGANPTLGRRYNGLEDAQHVGVGGQRREI